MELQQINQWETSLEHEVIIPSEIQKCISWQTIRDVRFSSFIDVIKYICSRQFGERAPDQAFNYSQKVLLRGAFHIKGDAVGIIENLLLFNIHAKL